MLLRVAAAVAASVLVLPLAMSQADAAPVVRFQSVQYNSPGTDTRSNASLNAEWVMIHNYGSTTRTLTGWTVRDAARHVYRFPTFKLRPGTSVRIHTGHGSNNATNLYWGSGAYIWNNTGDKATLKNPRAITVDTCSWGNGPGFTRC